MKYKEKAYSIALASTIMILFLIIVSSTASAATTTSGVVGTDYQYWSSEQYPLIDLFGEKYVPLLEESDQIWESHVDKLAKLVIDSEGSYNLKTGEKLDLGQGYSLQVKQVDVDGQKVWLEFDKDGQYVDDQIISTDSGYDTWNCTLDNIQGINNAPVLKVHVNQITQSATDSVVQIDGIWLMDYKNATTLQIGDKFGDYILTTIINGVDISNLGSLVFDSLMETRITNSESAIHSSIYGERIVWEDYRDKNSTSIYMYNLSTHKESQITNNESDQKNPTIYVDKIVYEDYRNGNWDIYMYDLSTSKEKRITTNVSDQFDPDIYGDRIVWQDWRNDNGDRTNRDIYMYDLSTSKETQITTSGLAYSTAIYGDMIVWMDYLNDDSFLIGDIYMYNLSTKKQTQITTSGEARCPKIYDNRMLWDDRQNISVYSLSTHNETKINVYGKMGSTAIYGDKIVWGEGCPPDAGDCQMYDLYMYDLSSSKTTQLTNNGSPKGQVSMFQNRITWTDYRNSVNNPDPDDYSYPDIYMITLRSTIPVAAFSASPTSGKAPLKVQFTDKSTGSPTSWKWNFGDKTSYSTAKNPSHKYSKAGKYTVRLTVKNAAGSNTKTMSEYIKVSKK